MGRGVAGQRSTHAAWQPCAAERTAGRMIREGKARPKVARSNAQVSLSTSAEKCREDRNAGMIGWCLALASHVATSSRKTHGTYTQHTKKPIRLLPHQDTNACVAGIPLEIVAHEVAPHLQRLVE